MVNVIAKKQHKGSHFLWKCLFIFGLINSYTAKAEVKFTEPSRERLASTSQPNKVEWSFFIYMQARNNLAPFAAKNLESIAKFKTNPNVNFIVQWDQPKQKGAWRYKIEHNTVSLENYTDVKNPTDQTGRFVDFVQWSAANFPAKKYCIIFWNHGVGPLNPPYGNPVRMLLSQQNQSISLNPEKYIFLNTDDAVPTEEEIATMTDLAASNRGILFDEDNRSYMTNDDISRALEKITSREILNQKIDCLGFDACYMGGLEIATEVSKYADYMIASQELELARGWNYEKITEKANLGNISSAQLAKIIVNSYGEMYKGSSNIYTQSAIKLSDAEKMTMDLNQVIDAIEAAAREDKTFLIETIRNARKNCLQFTAKVYIDLHSFYEHMLDIVESRLAQLSQSSQRYRPKKAGTSSGAQSSLENLVSTLKRAISGICNTVIENTCSNYLSRAKGVSIYFPLRGVDTSYEASFFARNSRWLNFIRAFSMR